MLKIDNLSASYKTIDGNVHVVKDVDFEIRDNEIFGIAGESGCGKSTLGRVLLQLYSQTAGCSLYYGTTLNEMTPQYVYDTLKHERKYRQKLDKAAAKARDLEKKVEAAGGEDGADFYLLQECNIAQCDEQTHLSNIVKILGGFYAKDDPEGISLLLDIYAENKKRNEILARRKTQELNEEQFAHEAAEAKNGKAAGLIRKKEKASARLAQMDSEIAEYDRKISALQDKLKAVKAKYKDDPEFNKYEGMLDNGIDLARLSSMESIR